MDTNVRPLVASEDVLDSHSDRVTKLEAAHIMPFMQFNYSSMQTLLSMFTGTNMEAILGGKSINNPTNIFCTDHDTHLKSDQVIIGTEYLNGRYLLRIVNARKARGPFIAHCQDSEVVIFGLGPRGRSLDMPDGELFNIHASEAGEAINRVLQDEADFNDGIVEDRASASRISAFALKVALRREMAVGSSESLSDNDTEAGKDVLRVTTNSQIGA
ncbi:hypothetical protein V1517DRAFT_351308 [Lipomyces orientalis]|uniref:Uncharacterized protein n=1 Tax=Lipomyces orientalis TaxID=1233043 RepID=A0ACC3TTW1_9ASCO